MDATNYSSSRAGEIRDCSLVHTDKHIMDYVGDLYANLPHEILPEPVVVFIAQ